MENNLKKPCRGRQRIEIKKVEKPSQLHVTFSKRRAGLFKKAGEISALCGGEMAVLVRSPANKVYAFGHPSAESILDRYVASPPGQPEAHANASEDEPGKAKYLEAKAKLEGEEAREKRIEEVMGGAGGNGLWWEAPIDKLGLDELEKYTAALEALQKNLLTRADELAMASASPSSFLDIPY
ncbi:hypothetical protein RJ639_036652 [Escallonia herrerae]|uniref:MADS-box domain-containing protein n=1 Tax=Escallonia herrerae TaxID=1293975 RepID=A0AA89B605_9ASTE|nr:hypothetical protein RJ639_036652 [Escallonia herrerae]